jgi:hypothetical protein
MRDTDDGHDRLDLGLAVDAMLAFAPIAAGEPPGI